MDMVLFYVELLAVGDALILYIVFLPKERSSADADAHEARFRSMRPESLPPVQDVYITTSRALEGLGEDRSSAPLPRLPELSICGSLRRPQALAKGILSRRRASGTSPVRQRARQGRQYQSRLDEDECEFWHCSMRISSSSAIF